MDASKSAFEAGRPGSYGRTCLFEAREFPRTAGPPRRRLLQGQLAEDRRRHAATPARSARN